MLRLLRSEWMAQYFPWATGTLLLPTLAEHMDVNALFLSNAGKGLTTEAQLLAVDNVKRVVVKDEDWTKESNQGP